jgi:hypothetical protein
VDGGHDDHLQPRRRDGGDQFVLAAAEGGMTHTHLDARGTITLGRLIETILRRWWVVLLGLLSGVALGALLSSVLPHYYRAEVTLAPAADVAGPGGAGLAGLAAQFGGVASLAGINLGASGTDRATLTLETLRGRRFLIDFARRRNLLVPLFASLGWDPARGEWIVDTTKYDPKSGEWAERGRLYKRREPTDGEIFRTMTKYVKVDQDRRTGLVRIAVDSASATQAAEWARLLVEDLNEFLRARDSEEAARTLAYLEQEASKTSIREMRDIFFRLIEEQTKTLMLARVRDEYALKVVDPPIVPDRPTRPSAVVVVLLGALGGACLAVIVVLMPRRRPTRAVEPS